jgi:hypothetical protein
MPGILATWEYEVRRIVAQVSPGKKQDLSPKEQEQKGLEVWLKQ